MFFAIKGENFDGNNLLNEALEKGSKLAVIDSNVNFNNNNNIIKVDDSLKTLQDLATYSIEKLNLLLLQLLVVMVKQQQKN